MRIAHFSDLHLMGTELPPFSRFMNKRATGYATLRFRRSGKHKPHAIRAVADEVKLANIDHVVITGDISNLALESEFETALDFLENDLGLHEDEVSIIPGNHDVYTQGSAKTRRFESYFGKYMKSDLPHFWADHGGGKYPFVKIRNQIAIIGMSTAVPRMPLRSAGRVGTEQLQALREILADERVKTRGKIILQHHPAHNLRNRLLAYLEGLEDAHHLIRTLHHLEHGLVLHGHSHIRVHRTIRTELGRLDVVGATSASLLSDHPHRHAGFNLYELDEIGKIKLIEAHVLNDQGRFERREIPADQSSERVHHG